MPSFRDQMEAMWRGERPRSQLGQTLGFELVDYELGSAFFTMQVDEQHWNTMGTVYGGVMTSIAEAAMGVAFASTLAEDEGFTVVDIRINFLKPIMHGRIDAKAKLIGRGRTLGFVECELRNEKDQLIAKASSTCMVLRTKTT